MCAVVCDFTHFNVVEKRKRSPLPFHPLSITKGARVSHDTVILKGHVASILAQQPHCQPFALPMPPDTLPQ